MTIDNIFGGYLMFQCPEPKKASVSFLKASTSLTPVSNKSDAKTDTADNLCNPLFTETLTELLSYACDVSDTPQIDKKRLQFGQVSAYKQNNKFDACAIEKSYNENLDDLLKTLTAYGISATIFNKYVVMCPFNNEWYTAYQN